MKNFYSQISVVRNISDQWFINRLIQTNEIIKYYSNKEIFASKSNKHKMNKSINKYFSFCLN